jgi:hypothetical protein
MPAWAHTGAVRASRSSSNRACNKLAPLRQAAPIPAKPWLRHVPPRPPCQARSWRTASGQALVSSHLDLPCRQRKPATAYGYHTASVRLPTSGSRRTQQPAPRAGRRHVRKTSAACLTRSVGLRFHPAPVGGRTARPSGLRADQTERRRSDIPLTGYRPPATPRRPCACNQARVVTDRRPGHRRHHRPSAPNWAPGPARAIGSGLPSTNS